MVSADGKSREIPLQRFPVTVGRGEECKVRIPLAAISRRHCELHLDDDELVVKDLQSANGTYVNAMKIISRELVPGDLLSVGPVVFVVRLNGHPKDVDPIECYAAGSVEPRDRAGPPRNVSSSGSSSMVDGMEGVPAWKPPANEKKAAPQPAAKSGSGPSKPAAKPASKIDDDDDDDGLGSLLADLDLSGLDDDEPDDKPVKKK